MYQKENPQKPPTKVKRTKEDMQIAVENKKKATTNLPKSAFKMNKVEEGGASSLGVKKEQENTYMMAQKMTRGIMELYVMPTMVRAMPTMVQVVRQTVTIP